MPAFNKTQLSYKSLGNFYFEWDSLTQLHTTPVQAEAAVLLAEDGSVGWAKDYLAQCEGAWFAQGIVKGQGRVLVWYQNCQPD